MDPRAILEMFPLAAEEGFPIQSKVDADSLLWLSETSKKTFSGALCPPQFRNHGNWITSVNLMVKWLAEKAEALGVEVYPGFAAAELLRDEQGAVSG